MNETAIDATGIGRFDAIDLAELDRLAALRTRFDLKYAVDEAGVRRLLADLPTRWSVLEIEGRRAFEYSSLYFDDDVLRCFHDHRRRRRLRFKLRSRRYESGAGATLELKTKDGRGRTVKQRLARAGSTDSLDLSLDFAEREWLDERLRTIGIRPASPRLAPVLAIGYRRTTLVEPALGERITIDVDLTATHRNRTATLVPRAAIVEWKSRGEHGETARLLRGLGLRPVSFSKYCVGLSAVGAVTEGRPGREAEGSLGQQRR